LINRTSILSILSHFFYTIVPFYNLYWSRCITHSQ